MPLTIVHQDSINLTTLPDVPADVAAGKIVGSWWNKSLTYTGTLEPSAVGAAGSSGQVQFNSAGVLGGDSTFSWDNTNKRLGVGTASPAAKLSVVGALAVNENVVDGLLTIFDSTNTRSDHIVLGYSSGAKYTIGRNANAFMEFRFNQAGGGYTFYTAANAIPISMLDTGLVGVGFGQPTGQLHVQTQSASRKALVVQGAASQTANLQEWQDSAGTRLASFNASATVLHMPIRMAIGNGATVTGDGAVALGYLASAASLGVSIGQQAVAAANSFAIGFATSASNGGICMGFATVASGSNSLSIGTSASATGTFAMAFGYGATAPNSGDICFAPLSSVPKLQLQTLTSTGTMRSAMQLLGEWADNTDASRKGRMTLSAIDATATREGIRIESDGSNANISFYKAGSWGGGSKVLFVANASTVPASNPTGGGILYVESGALKYRGSSGTITTLANA